MYSRYVDENYRQAFKITHTPPPIIMPLSPSGGHSGGHSDGHSGGHSGGDPEGLHPSYCQLTSVQQRLYMNIRRVLKYCVPKVKHCKTGVVFFKMLSKTNHRPPRTQNIKHECIKLTAARRYTQITLVYHHLCLLVGSSEFTPAIRSKWRNGQSAWFNTRVG
jgi:hypothetical protein